MGKNGKKRRKKKQIMNTLIHKPKPYPKDPDNYIVKIEKIAAPKVA